LFIATANTLDTVPRPLLDRLEVLPLSGYTEEEKLVIARRFLIPRQQNEAGLRPEQLTLSDLVLRRMVSRYTPEAGLRQLERALGKTARQAALRFAEQGTTDAIAEILPDQLEEILGPAPFPGDLARKDLPAGVAVGIAWTEAGGEVLYVEAALLDEGSG